VHNVFVCIYALVCINEEESVARMYVSYT